MSAPLPRFGPCYKVLIVDDHPIVCQGLKAIIDLEVDLSVCGVAEDVVGALRVIAKKDPDIAIVDLNLKGGDGLELIKANHSQGRDLPILVLSMHDEGLFAERALRAGAKGYLMKQEASDKVINALRNILRGELFVSEALRNRLAEASKAHPESDPVADLSDRELQVFRLIGLGQGTRNIAETLNLSIKTIESHRRNIKQKLGIRSAPELVRHAVRFCEQN